MDYPSYLEAIAFFCATITWQPCGERLVAKLESGNHPAILVSDTLQVSAEKISKNKKFYLRTSSRCLHIAYAMDRFYI